MSSEYGPGRKAIFAYTAGQVRRWHTATHIHRQQNVMEHSGGVAMWIALFHPNPSANLLKAALTHDLAELKTGDVPRWAKKSNPDIDVLLKAAEEKVLIPYGLQSLFDTLPYEDELWLKAADLFDAWMFMFHNALYGGHSLRGDLNKATRYLEEGNKDGLISDTIIIAMRQIRTLYPWVHIW